MVFMLNEMLHGFYKVHGGDKSNSVF